MEAQKKDEAKIDFHKAEMLQEDKRQDENLGTLQKITEETARKVPHTKKK